MCKRIHLGVKKMNFYRLIHWLGIAAIAAIVVFLGVEILQTARQEVPQTAISKPFETGNAHFKANFDAELISDAHFLTTVKPDVSEPILPEMGSDAESSFFVEIPDRETDDSWWLDYSSAAESSSGPLAVSGGSSGTTSDLSFSSPVGGSSSGDSSSSGAPSSSSASPSSAAPSSGSTSAAAGGTDKGTSNTSDLKYNYGGGIPPSTEVSIRPEGFVSVFLRGVELSSENRRLPLSTAMDNLLKYDAFWGAQLIARNHSEAWRTLRTQYPDRMALRYVSLFTVRPDDTEWYMDYQYIEKNHPEWFLLKDEQHAKSADYRNPDKRIRWNPNDPSDWRYNRFFLDVGNEDFQRWAAEELLKKLEPVSGVNARLRYSGIAGDNALFHPWAIEKTKLYPNWKYPENRGSQWTQAFISYLKKLHETLKSKGYVLIVNATIEYYDNSFQGDWELLTKAVDGLVKEWGVRYSTGLYSNPSWESIVHFHEQNIDRGLYDWWLFDDFGDYKKLPFTEYQHFLYEYCSYLLIKQKGQTCYGVFEASQNWFEEFDLPLGDPVGLRYQRDDCWFRDYQYGKVAVNPSKTRHTFILDSDKYTLDWVTKRTITQLTLEPRSATILLPTGYSIR